MNKILGLLIVFTFIAVEYLMAEVKPNSLFSDGAVLQRDMAVPVWGTARDGERITVTFHGQSVTTTARNGKWLIHLQSLKADSTPATMTIVGENTVTIRNVLVGEVWLCSGQSNMQRNLLLSEDGPAVVAAANDPQLHLLVVPRTEKDEPQSEVTVTWSECCSNSAPNFSAVAYFFGRDLRRKLGVPVGLILSCLGGTPAEAWTDRQTLENNPLLKSILERQAKAEAEFTPEKLAAENERRREQYEQEVAQAKAQGKPKPDGPVVMLPPKMSKLRPCCLFNGMIAPLVPFTIRGVIWYQGENNNGNPKQYRTLFPALINDWRTIWNQGCFPFLFVQIAPYKSMRPELREAQLQTWKATTNTAMVVTTDVGEADEIHYKRKAPVGARLVLGARALAYGENIEYSGPVYETNVIRGQQMVLSFSHVGDGLLAKDGELKGFTIAGKDKKFIPAKAAIVDNTIVVSSPLVPDPVAVRYGWANVPGVNLFNKNGLPASPFRTDTDDH